ncbi:SMP-30/gluconolactonase/LRE family protein [Pseudohaliea rubra]|uniref:5-valerolactone hydrolase n=1 Tax=Pseudohaliea rubra DSM 19751 TaxID=1265313 RepID=A0A095VPB2_9GAMM|nr:SMP-30/gluconolactonase/LRE family protein [Pseudohaliea rubra]KGE02953.1 5-valerolactone hydrolase [Pseudohaliea rubra DSM 19751]
MAKAEIVAEGLYFGEGPRWYGGRLWFSDFYERAVRSLGPDGDLRTELQLQCQPSGLGWLPDGTLLIVDMEDHRVLRHGPGGLADYASLGEHSRHLANDMVVADDGRAFVGNFGFDLDAALAERGAEAVLADHPKTNLMTVSPEGHVDLAAADLSFPNGMVITPDGATLVVAETLGLCLTAFELAADGTLTKRRVWAALEGVAADGICLDAEGCIWVANALAPECLRIAEGGEVRERVETSQNCYACMLGGDDGRDLYLVTARDSNAAVAKKNRSGRIERCRVEVPHAGRP